MSDVTVGRTALRRRQGGEAQPAVATLDLPRALQLGLAALWLLDGVLQFQPFMYTKAFTQMLASSAAGNPAVIARPITWDASLLQHHLVPLNTIFATIQLLLGLGIALRPTVRPALAASVAWSLAVWWLGEGFGGILSGTASPVGGAPGAVILYALLAVLLSQAGRQGALAPFVAARAVGERAARALWLVLWLSLAYFALTPANRALGAPVAPSRTRPPASPAGWPDWTRARPRLPPGTGWSFGDTRRGLRGDSGRRLPAGGRQGGHRFRDRGRGADLGHRAGARDDPRHRGDGP